MSEVGGGAHSWRLVRDPAATRGPVSLASRQQADQEHAEVLVCCCPGPHVVVGGPGAGKTAVLVGRVRSDLDRGLPLLVLSFTRAGKAVLSLRLSAAVGRSRTLRISTTMAACHSAYRGSHKGFSKLGRGEQRRRLHQALRTCGQTSPRLESILRRAVQAFEDGTELPTSVREVVTEEVRALYRAEKMRDHVYGDDDMRFWVAQNAEQVVQGWLRAGYRVVYLDEYQDSSPAEVALMAASVRAGLEVWVVGDPRQTLYGFRGARPDLLTAGLESFPGCHHHVLTVNRRSRTEVVRDLNRFAERFFVGASAKPTAATTSGGRGLAVVHCDEPAGVLDALTRALRAVDGLATAPARASGALISGADLVLGRALGLPVVPDPDTSIAILCATGGQAREVAKSLRRDGFVLTLLVRDEDHDTALGDLLRALLDPKGVRGGLAAWHGAAAPIATLLNSLRDRPHYAMQRDTRPAKAVDKMLVDLRRSAEEGVELEGLFRQTLGYLNYWAAGRGPARVAGSARRSRLREFATAAAACLGQLRTIFESEQSGELDSKGAYRRLLELGDQYFGFAAEGAEQHDDGTVRWAALPAWLARTYSSRLDAAAALEEIATRPSGKLARPSKNGGTGAQASTSDAEDSVARGPVLYVAVINQVKGMEFDHVIILALDPGRFPYGGEDCEAERCRWWVALSRAIKSAAYLGVPGNDLYWAERHDIEHQSTSHPQRRAAG